VGQVRWGADSALTADQVHGTEGAGPKPPTKRDAMLAYMKDHLARAGEDGLEREALESDAAKVAGSGSRSAIYAVRQRLAPDVVEFKADPDNPGEPIPPRLKE